MTIIKHFRTYTPGKTPVGLGLQRGQLAINVPDQTVYAVNGSGQVQPISKGQPGLSSAQAFTGVHIPVNFHPVAQLAPGVADADLQAGFFDNGTQASMSSLQVFAFGKLWSIPSLTTPSTATGNYQLTLSASSRVATLSAATLNGTSGLIDFAAGTITLLITEGRPDPNQPTVTKPLIKPWFYIQKAFPTTNNGTSQAELFRISDVQMSGAIPVSQGFAGKPATAYWGAKS